MNAAASLLSDGDKEARAAEHPCRPCRMVGPAVRAPRRSTNNMHDNDDDDDDDDNDRSTIPALRPDTATNPTGNCPPLPLVRSFPSLALADDDPGLCPPLKFRPQIDSLQYNPHSPHATNCLHNHSPCSLAFTRRPLPTR